MDKYEGQVARGKHPGTDMHSVGEVWMASYYDEYRIQQVLIRDACWDVETLRGGGIDFKADDVTHWMPLPEPPEGEENES